MANERRHASCVFVYVCVSAHLHFLKLLTDFHENWRCFVTLGNQLKSVFY